MYITERFCRPTRSDRPCAPTGRTAPATTAFLARFEKQVAEAARWHDGRVTPGVRGMATQMAARGHALAGEARRVKVLRITDLFRHDTADKSDARVLQEMVLGLVKRVALAVLRPVDFDDASTSLERDQDVGLEGVLRNTHTRQREEEALAHWDATHAVAVQGRSHDSQPA
ncbi:hypothetical protein EJK15_12825 [Nonomuraea basaltis]|nr:hypothetical protein EJK15_12825 [Nonomuraea basaltis]